MTTLLLALATGVVATAAVSPPAVSLPAPSRPGASASDGATSTLPLARAITDTLASSPELRQAGLDLDRANVGLAGARAERLTYSADINLADGYGASGLFGATSPTLGQVPVLNATLAARVPLFSGFRVEREIDRASAGVVAGHAQLDQARQTLVWNVTEAYWLARRAELHEAIAADATTRARQARDIVQAARKIGRASEGEVDSAEVTALDQEGEWLRAQDDRQVARDRLASLLQRDLTGVKLEDPTPGGSTPTEDAAIQLALAHRPDVRLARAQLAANQAAVASAAADRWPQLALEGAYQHGNNPYDPAAQSHIVLDRLTGDAYARLNLTYHLFDQGTVGRNIEARSLEARSAEQALLAAERTAHLEVKQALARLAGARRRVALGERSVAVATRSVAYLENRFRFGYALITELNEARQNLVTANMQRTDAQIDAALARSALARATGTLEAPVKPPGSSR